MTVGRILADVIDAERERIVDRFVEEAQRGGLVPPSTSRRDTIDHLRTYLAELASALRARMRSSSEVAERAQQHGVQRWVVGAPIDGLVQEYALLRRIILDAAAAEEVAPSPDEVEALRAQLQVSLKEALRAFAAAKDADVAFERQRFATLIRIAPVGMFVADAEGGVVEVNEAARRIWGTAETSTTAEHAFATFRGYWPDGRSIAPTEWTMARAMRTGEIVENEEIDLVGFDGRRRTILSSAAPVRRSDGSVGGAICSNVDITERKRAELRSRVLVRASEILARSHDVKVALPQVLALPIPSLADVVAFEPLASFLPRVVVDRGPDGAARSESDPREPFLRPELVAELARSRDPRACTTAGEVVPLRLGDERAASLTWCASPVLLGEAVGVLFLGAYEAARPMETGCVELARHLGERIAQAVQAALLFKASQDAVAAREEALTTVSHDLRGPLGVVLGTAELLERLAETTPIAPERVRAKAQAIARAARTMTQLVTDLLDLSRIEAGHACLASSALSTRGLLESAVEAQRALAEDAGVRLVVDGPAEDARVRGDADRLAQVFANLVGNAIKFSTRDAEVVLGASVEPDAVRFCVTDRGCGIPVDALPHLFTPYWQVPGTKTGTGLGLTIAKRIVEAHRGRIWAENVAGGGARFAFTLPRA